MTNYLIIDDEHMAHEIIKGYCDLLPHMNLVRHCYDAIEALDCLREHQVDLIFLDLNMPKLKGFDFLKTLKNSPKVIVTTAYKEHALEGYELEIVDYLLKPFGFERFLKAVNKAMQLFEEVPSQKEEKGTPRTDSIFVYSDKKHIQVVLANILFVEAAGNYAKIVLKDRNILIREKISRMAAKLFSNDFVQVHKSYIVSKAMIDSIEGNRILIGDDIIPIGKSYKSNVEALLKRS